MLVNKPFAVIQLTEDKEEKITEEIVNKGLPHYSLTKRKELMKHYLGVLFWEKVCNVTGIDYHSLPKTVEDSIEEYY